MAFGIDGGTNPRFLLPGVPRNRDPEVPPPGGAPPPTTQPPTTKPPVTRVPPPQWKTDLWNQFVKEGKPGDWQAYWRSHRGGAAPVAPTDPGSGPRPMAPINPAVPPAQPATPGQMMPALGPLPTPDYGQPWGQAMPGDYNDPYNAYLAAVPVMENMRDEQISDAMATAGFSGNRYGSAAADQAMKIGAQTSQALNQMLNQTMFDQSNRDLDRALQASGLGMQLGQMQDEMARNRLGQLFGFGQYEQGRQDNFANMAYQDFLNSRMGYLPLIAQVLGGTGAPNPGTPVQTVQNPGTPPKIPPELLPLLQSIFS